MGKSDMRTSRDVKAKGRAAENKVTVKAKHHFLLFYVIYSVKTIVIFSFYT